VWWRRRRYRLRRSGAGRAAPTRAEALPQAKTKAAGTTAESARRTGSFSYTQEFLSR
jgi:hypothetical protein